MSPQPERGPSRPAPPRWRPAAVTMAGVVVKLAPGAARGTRCRPLALVIAQLRRAAGARFAPADSTRPRHRATPPEPWPRPGMAPGQAWPELPRSPTLPVGWSSFARPRSAQVPGRLEVAGSGLPTARSALRLANWRREAPGSPPIALSPLHPNWREQAAAAPGRPTLLRPRSPVTRSGDPVARDALGAPSSVICGEPRAIRARPPPAPRHEGPAAACPIRDRQWLLAIASGSAQYQA
jgi:hypothetical protein